MRHQQAVHQQSRRPTVAVKEGMDAHKPIVGLSRKGHRMQRPCRTEPLGKRLHQVGHPPRVWQHNR